MPKPVELPADLRGLTRRNAFIVADRTTHSDIAGLAREVRKVVAGSSSSDPTDSAEPRPVRPAVGADQTSASPQPGYPARFTDRWLRENVPTMDREEILRLVAALRDRRWSSQWIIDYALCYARENAHPGLRRPLGSPLEGGSFDLPKRMTVPWLRSSAPTLTSDEVATVASALIDRNWTDGEIEEYLLSQAPAETVTSRRF